MAQNTFSHFSHSHPGHGHEHKKMSESGSREMPPQQDTINHFSHPEHELVKRHYIGQFVCDMCWENLTGPPAYGCVAGCDFAIHESCAGHPQTLTSPDHHVHPLTLVQTRRDVAAHICDVCVGRCAPGAFLYRCLPCDFDMHPSCVRLPLVVRSTRHLEHDLTLVVADGLCAACGNGGGGAVRATYYRCAACNVDFHISCAASVGENSSARPEDEAIAQIQAASAAQMRIRQALTIARIQEQGSRAALELVSPSSEYTTYYTTRRQYFF